MFVKSTKAAKEAGITSRTAAKKRFDFLNKKRNKFYVRVVPNELDGYMAQPIAYHRHLAKINITNKHTGQESSFEVNSACVMSKGVSCPGCEAADKQKNNPSEKNRSDFYKIDKSQIVRHFFLVYEVFLNEDGSFYYSSDPKESTPKILEYPYRKGVCQDFDNFVDAYEAALAKGIDPCDPINGVVFRIERQEIPTGYGNSKKVVYAHTATDKKLSLPSQWKSQLQNFDLLDDRYMKFSADDLRIIVETDEAIKTVLADSTISANEKEAIVVSLTEEFKKVSHQDFVNIIDFLENKEPSDEVVKQPNSYQEPKVNNSFSKTSNSHIQENKPIGEESNEMPKQNNSSNSPGTVSSDHKGALDRIKAIKAARNQNN